MAAFVCKNNRFELKLVALANGYPQELVGWECGIRTRKYIKMNLKKCFCVEVFVE